MENYLETGRKTDKTKSVRRYTWSWVGREEKQSKLGPVSLGEDSERRGITQAGGSSLGSEQFKSHIGQSRALNVAVADTAHVETYAQHPHHSASSATQLHTSAEAVMAERRAQL